MRLGSISTPGRWLAPNSQLAARKISSISLTLRDARDPGRVAQASALSAKLHHAINSTDRSTGIHEPCASEHDFQ